MSVFEIIKLIVHDYLVLFAMVNAVGNLPIFAEMTRGMEPAARSRVYRVAVLVGGGIVLTFALFGDFLLRSVFEVATTDFKIAGGILIFIVAVRGVMQGPRQRHLIDTHNDNFAVFPLGFPYLAGPGTILTTIILFQKTNSIYTIIAAILVYISLLPLLHLAPQVEKLIGNLTVRVISRILYILITAKAISFIVDGAKQSFGLS